MAISHAYSQTIADGTATSVVRPSDWNSAHNQYMTIGSNTAGVSTLSGTNIQFNGGNNITLSANANTLIFSVGNYITTGMLSNAGSNFVAATAAFNGTNISGTIGSNGLSLSVNAGGAGDGYNVIGVNGAGTQLSTTLQLSNANNVSFGLNLGTITASASYPAQTVDTNKAGTGFTSTSTGGVAIVGTNNTNGLSLGIPNYLTTAQPVGAYLTTARASNDAVGLNTALTANGVAWTVNSSGISLNVPAFLTTGANSTHSHGNPTLALTNLTGTTASASNGLTLSLSGNAAQTTQTQPAGNIAGVGTTFGGTNVSGSMTMNSNGLVLSLSAPTPGGGGAINVSAGTTSGNLQTIQFDNGNGVSFGLNGSTVTASVNAAGGGVTASTYIPYYPASTGVQTIGAQGATSASAWFFPVSIIHPVVFNQLRQLVTASFISSSVAGSQTVTHHFGLFRNNAGTLSVISSNSYSIGATASSGSATINTPNEFSTAGGYTYQTYSASTSALANSLFGTVGNRIMTFGFSNTMSLSAGLYWLGIHQRQSSSSANIGMAFALAGNVMLAAQNAGPLGTHTSNYITNASATLFKVPWGVASSTGSAGYGGSRLPDAVNITAMSMTLTQIPMMTFISA